MSVHLICGGAGFVGVNLIRRILKAGGAAIAVDDLSRGRRELVDEFMAAPNFLFYQADCSDADALYAIIKKIDKRVDHVWHLAANSDIPAGIADPRIDLCRTFLTTFGILDVMRRAAIANLHFASSSAIYGDLGDREIHEDIGPLQPISNYGAMKLASEAQIRAAVESFLPRANIFRFPNVVGLPATHGVILDFVRKLQASPDNLDVLGDGTQQKAYLHVADLIDAMLHISSLSGTYNVFNIGPADHGVRVSQIAEAVRDRVSRHATITYGREGRGWVGDVPRFRYSVRKLADAGWSPKLSSEQAMLLAVDEIARQELSS